MGHKVLIKVQAPDKLHEPLPYSYCSVFNFILFFLHEMTQIICIKFPFGIYLKKGQSNQNKESRKYDYD